MSHRDVTDLVVERLAVCGRSDGDRVARWTHSHWLDSGTRRFVRWRRWRRTAAAATGSLLASASATTSTRHVLNINISQGSGVIPVRSFIIILLQISYYVDQWKSYRSISGEDMNKSLRFLVLDLRCTSKCKLPGTGWRRKWRRVWHQSAIRNSQHPN